MAGRPRLVAVAFRAKMPVGIDGVAAQDTDGSAARAYDARMSGQRARLVAAHPETHGAGQFEIGFVFAVRRIVRDDHEPVVNANLLRIFTLPAARSAASIPIHWYARFASG